MKVTDISALMNAVTKETTGKENVFTEDLSNVIDGGKELFGLTDVDNFVKTLIDHIGKIIFVNRPYKGRIPSVLMDSWEFGAVLEKVSYKMPDADENESWQLVNGASYDPNIFYEPKVTVKFFDTRVTLEVPYSIADKQVKSAFSSAEQLNGFISGLVNAVDKSMTKKLDALVMRTINNFTSETIYNEFKDGKYSNKSGIRAINLLAMWNKTHNDKITADTWQDSPEFLKFASKTMNNTIKYMQDISVRYNIGGEERFTPDDMLHVVLLQDFVSTFTMNLQSDTFHDTLVALPNYETVSFWQGDTIDGTTVADFKSLSTIDVVNSWGHNVKCSGIVGVMFDRDALGVCCMNRRATSTFNPKAEFYNNWQKMDASYFNDTNENFVVFFIA